MRSRLFRAIAIFTLLCGFTLIYPFHSAFAENTEYRKVSLNEWVKQNCKVVVINDTIKNTPFYLQYKNDSGSTSWVIGSYGGSIGGSSNPMLVDGAKKDFIASTPTNDICIRVSEKNTASSTSNHTDKNIFPLKTTIYAGANQIGEKSNNTEIDSTKFRVDWKVVQVTAPEGIIQKDFEIGKLSTESTTTDGSSRLHYQPLVANTLLVKDMLLDSEEGLHFSFKSAGIYTLKVQVDIKYNGNKDQHLSTTYKIIVGDEANFKNKTSVSENNASVDDKGKNNDNTNVNTTDNNDIENSIDSIPEVDIKKPKTFPAHNKHSYSTKKHPTRINTKSQKQKAMLAPAEKKEVEKQESDIQLPAETPATKNIPSTDQSDTITSSSTPPAAISKADRTVAQEAGFNFLKTAPLLIVGVVVVVGAGAAVTLIKLKP